MMRDVQNIDVRAPQCEGNRNLVPPKRLFLGLI
jgi:hypothetical protein